jgi:hypothetical protein
MGVLAVVSKTESQIVLSWSTLTEVQTGNSPIVSYTLYFDNATGTPNIQLANSLVSTYTVNGLVGG